MIVIEYRDYANGGEVVNNQLMGQRLLYSIMTQYCQLQS